MIQSIAVVGAVNRFATERFLTATMRLGLMPIIVERTSTKEAPQLSQWRSIYLRDLEEERAQELALLLTVDRPLAVVPGGELAVPLADATARLLGLRHHPGKSGRFRDKELMRLILAKAGVAQPRQLSVVGLNDPIPAFEATTFPVVVKPADGAASFNVRKCLSHAEIEDAIARVRSHTHSIVTGIAFARRALVEEYVSGDEFSAEVVVRGGRVANLFVHRKILSKEPFFDEIGHVGLPLDAECLPSTLPEFIAGVVSCFALIDGVAHIEFRVNPYAVPMVIEIAARVPGDLISELIESRSGLSLEEEFLRARAGLPEAKLQSGDNKTLVGVKFLFTGDDPDAETSVEILRKETAAHYAPVVNASPFHVTRRVGLVTFRTTSLADALSYLQR